MDIETKLVHSGEEGEYIKGSLTLPIFQTSTYIFKNMNEVKQYTDGELEHFEYGRYGNPTQRVVENKIAEIEKAEESLLFPSGMNAITTTLFALAEAGDHIIITDDSYKKTYEFVTNVMSKYNVDYSVVPYGDYQAIEKSITDKTRLLFFESPTNPYLNIMDFDLLINIAVKHKLILIIDGSFASFVIQCLIEYGVDLVIHSGIKYLAGHNDILAGVVSGKTEYIEKIRKYRDMLGGIISPNSCYVLNKGLKTLGIRVEKQNGSAMKIAEFLNANPLIDKVYYPGLKNFKYYDIAKKQMNGFGAVITFEINKEITKVIEFFNNLKLCKIGPSFGGVETLITHPATVSYYMYGKEERYKLGITDGLVRLSVGIESVEDILRDIENALKSI